MKPDLPPADYVERARLRPSYDEIMAQVRAGDEAFNRRIRAEAGIGAFHVAIMLAASFFIGMMLAIGGAF